MNRIESAANPRIKALSRILRKGDFRDSWVVEGKTLFEEAVASGVVFDEIYVTEETALRLEDVLKDRSAMVTLASARVMKAISTLETPPGIVAVAARREAPAPQRIRGFAALLAGVRDPGNAGTLIRSAEATGCEYVACSMDSADPYSPKVIRASMGSIFRVPVFRVPDAQAHAEEARRQGARIYALHPRRGTMLPELRPQWPALIVAGGETAGVPGDLPVDEWVTIPMKGRVESLNAAVAATLCFYRFMTGPA